MQPKTKVIVDNFYKSLKLFVEGLGGMCLYGTKLLIIGINSIVEIIAKSI